MFVFLLRVYQILPTLTSSDVNSDIYFSKVLKYLEERLPCLSFQHDFFFSQCDVISMETCFCHGIKKVIVTLFFPIQTFFPLAILYLTIFTFTLTLLKHRGHYSGELFKKAFSCRCTTSTVDTSASSYTLLPSGKPLYVDLFLQTKMADDQS